MAQEDLPKAKLKQKGMSKVCDVAFSTYVSISHLVFLNKVLRDIKQITIGQKNFRCPMVEKVCKVKYTISRTLEWCHVHKPIEGSAKPCNKTSS